MGHALQSSEGWPGEETAREMIAKALLELENVRNGSEHIKRHTGAREQLDHQEKWKGKEMTAAEHQDTGENGTEPDPAIQERNALDAQTEHQVTYWLNATTPRKWKDPIPYWKRKQAIHGLLEKLHEENPELVSEMAKNNYNRAATRDEQMERDRALFHAAAGVSQTTRDQDQRDYTADLVARLITENAREETRFVRLRAATWEKQVDYEDSIESASPQFEEIRAFTPEQHDKTLQRSKREIDRLEHIHSLSFDHSYWNERNRVLEQVNGAMTEINRITSGEEYRARPEQEKQEKQERQKDGLTRWLKGMFRKDREDGNKSRARRQIAKSTARVLSIDEENSKQAQNGDHDGDHDGRRPAACGREPHRRKAHARTSRTGKKGEKTADRGVRKP